MISPGTYSVRQPMPFPFWKLDGTKITIEVPGSIIQVHADYRPTEIGLSQLCTIAEGVGYIHEGDLHFLLNAHE